MKRLFILALLLGTTSLASADELGFGAYVRGGEYSVQDPDGDTADDSAYAPGIFMTYDLSARNRRVIGGIEFIEFELPGSMTEIGQTVEGITAFAGYEYQWVLSRNVKVWLGANVTANTHEFTSRFDVASDGFLGTVYRDREETYFGVRLTANSYLFNITERWKLGVGAYWDYPFADGVEAIGVTFSLGRE